MIKSLLVCLMASQRRKYPEVPVHGELKKTFSANFNPKSERLKTVDVQEIKRKAPPTIEEEANETEDVEMKVKVSKKVLRKEVERLGKENGILVEKLARVESNLGKKNLKLREKIQALHNYNDQVVNDYEKIRVQYHELYATAQELQAKVEQSKICVSCEKLKGELENAEGEYRELRKTNKELLEDINMLKNVVYRLNLQMEGYQEKLRKHNLKVRTFTGASMGLPENLSKLDSQSVDGALNENHHTDHAHSPVSWGKVNAHTLGPLLDSYQETITEKEEIINSYEVEFSNFSGRLKEVVAENDALHRRLTEDEHCSTKLSEELEVVRRELKTTKEQNDLLIKKCALKQDKAEEILKCFEKKVNQMQLDYKTLHEEYFKCRNEISVLQEKNKALLMTKEEFKSEREQYIPIAVHTVTVNECKRLYEELKSQYEHEKDKLRESLSEKAKEIADLTNKIHILTSEKDELENKVKTLEKHVKKLEAKYLDLQHTLNEVQLSRSACRKQLHKAMSFAKELVSEQENLLQALNDRKQENKAVMKIGSDIANRMDTLKGQLKTVQRDAWQELQTVEVRLQEKDSLITAMKEEYVQEIERLKCIIEEQGLKVNGKVEDSSIPMPHYLLFRDRHNIDT